MEVLLTQSTIILTSPRRQDNILPLPHPLSSDTITLEQLPDIQNYQHVSVMIKVLRISEKQEVKAELEKQDITISDATGTARLTLWQENIGKLDVDDSYEIKDLIVNSYNGTKYLTSPKSGCTITPLDDIRCGAVEEKSEDEPGKE